MPFPRMPLCELLEQHGYQVELSDDVTQALTKLENFSIDLVITEFSMPKICGGDLVTSIKERKCLPDLPVIVLIYPWHAKDMAAVKQAGAFAIMTAPYDFEELLGLVVEATQGKSVKRNAPPNRG